MALSPLITQVLGMEITLGGGGHGKHRVHLAGAGQYLARHYLSATTDHRCKPRSALHDWWLSSGIPALIIEYDISEYGGNVIMPPHSRFVHAVSDARATLSYTWFEVGQRCCVWIIRHGHSGNNPDAARKLRMHLLRLHSERECLRRIIQHAESKRLSPESDAVQRYLSDALHLVQRPRRMGLPQGAMLVAALEAIAVALPGESTSLWLSRRRITSRVRSYMEAGRRTAPVVNCVNYFGPVNQYQGNAMHTNIQMGKVTVSGDFTQVTAANIQDSFVKIVSSDVGDPLREKLQELAVQVAHLAKQLPPDQAEHISTDFESLSSEALSKAPRQKRCELSAEGLLEAAKAVADMAEPVSRSVRAVLDLMTF